VLREAALILLGEDEPAVADDVELPRGAGNDARIELGSVELGRETRSPAVVAASGGAVVDLDRHAPQATWHPTARAFA
jgi:hypothetical protein